MKYRVYLIISIAALACLLIYQGFGPYLLDNWPWLLAVGLGTLILKIVFLDRAELSLKDNVVAVMGIVILGFCAYGFGSKFIELVRLVVSDNVAAQEGVFAVAPLMNYLLASAGFLCLLGWATVHGMFRDIEQPKQTMLEVNAQLDSQSNDLDFCDSVLRKGGPTQ